MNFHTGEKITVMPRNYPLELRHGGSIPSHYAIIGMAHIADDYPLYYDAVNEMGLGIAGLNFVGNAIYSNVKTDAETLLSTNYSLAAGPVWNSG